MLALITLTLACLLAGAATGARVGPSPAPAPVLSAPAPAPAAAPVWAKPTFCKELECPEFTVVHRSPDASVEVRDYAPSVWATTTLPPGAPWLMARSDGFKRLFDYISAHGIEMTTPVVYRVAPGDGAMKAAFMLPSDALTTAPRSDGAVTLEEWPAMRVAARSWAGVIDGRGVVGRQASEAAKGAAAAGFTTATSPGAAPYYNVGYDGPNTPAPSRRHEVWLPVTASPVEAAPVAQAG